jgi:hypothetical protein
VRLIGAAPETIGGHLFSVRVVRALLKARLRTRKGTSEPECTVLRLVARRPRNLRPLFFLLHRATAAFDRTSTTLGDDHLRAALSTDVNLPQLISHFLPFSGNPSCRCEAWAPQVFERS